MEDLFEKLPDELVIHIISFLPTKHAVSTSVLSKRWKFLWCYALKSLHFDDSVSFNHAFHEDVGYYGLEIPHRLSSFNNFVDTVLKLIKVPQVDNFFLKMYPFYSGFNPVHSWLDHIVTTRQAKEIHLHFSLSVCLSISRVVFPFEIFNSASLRVLKLYFRTDHPLTPSNNSKRRLFLPNLNILHFWMDDICDQWCLLNSLFRASPQLEEAYFGGDLGKSKRFCNIYAPSLKRLRMKFRSAESSNKFLVNAPILEELLVVDQAFQEHVLKSNCLVSAKLDIGFPGVGKFPELHARSHRVCKLLRRISRVKFLNLRAHTMDALSIYCNNTGCNLPQFPALCQLKLCFRNYSSWDVIPKLLECVPNLEVLVISKDFKGKNAQFRRDSVWTQPSSVPVCLVSTLRQVEVGDCESHQVEFNLINYLLVHGNALCTFLVELFPADSRIDLRFNEKLMLIPRVSKACELKISVYPHNSQQRGFFPDEEKIPHLTKIQRMPPQKMSFEDLRMCTDYFSDDHLIIRTRKFKFYRGKLYQSSSFDSPFRDVVVKRWIIPAESPYVEHKETALCTFREELKLLEHPNFKYHPYFISVLGCVAEDNNERLGVVYDFKPLDCLHNLIPKDSFKWLQRMKVALVLACILEYMHKKHEDLPSVTPRVSPSCIMLDEDYVPALFNLYRRQNYFQGDDDQYDYKGIKAIYHETRSDSDVYRFGLVLLGLISKRVHRCPNGRYHTSECRTMSQWAMMQEQDRYISSSLCKSQIPLVHTNLMDDSSYDIADGLKITRLAMRCLGTTESMPSMYAIVKYLCKLRVVRENWDVLNCDNVIGEYLNVLAT
ncbi:hypothetical protein KSS87_019625 [Heliosperma pusillum]|nr:hypothetical protein KSS87_019625 [Heliosperma pusillum]